MVFWHIDMRIDCSGPYCIPVPQAILAVGKNPPSKWWLGTTVKGITETSDAHSFTGSEFFTWAGSLLERGRQEWAWALTADLENLDMSPRKNGRRCFLLSATAWNVCFYVGWTDRGQPDLVIAPRTQCDTETTQNISSVSAESLPTCLQWLMWFGLKGGA